MMALQVIDLPWNMIAAGISPRNVGLCQLVLSQVPFDCGIAIVDGNVSGGHLNLIVQEMRIVDLEL
jgi:hypothetical protein